MDGDIFGEPGRVPLAVLDRLAGGVYAAGPVPPPVVPPGTNPLYYSVNQLLDEMRQAKPELVGAAMADDPDPPKLFGTTDLPPFTASGIDPQVLASLPWPIRRPVAEAPTLQAAYELADAWRRAPARPGEAVLGEETGAWLAARHGLPAMVLTPLPGALAWRVDEPGS